MLARFGLGILALLSFGLLHQLLPVDGSRVSINNNGYRDIVVAISPIAPVVRQNLAEDLIQNIKTMMTDASAALYTATHQRSYFQSVTILIPETWTSIASNSSTWETFNDADVQIDLPNWRYGDEPYTVQLGGCGDPGKYIHITPNYLINMDSIDSKLQFGPPGAAFVREWARLRYGVFEERGYTGDDASFPMFYRESGSEVPLVPNVCSDQQPVLFDYDNGCHVDPQTGLYDSQCTYTLRDGFKPTSSIMSDRQMLQSTMHFCDDDAASAHPHNRQAPNKQNAVCNLRSIWSVVSQHPDFANDNNPPTQIVNTKPNFNVVRVTRARYVLVLDISGSMDSYNRIGRLNEAARRWIKYDITDGTALGIVSFGTSATILSSLTIVGDATRQQLMDKIPNKTEGTTCIGCGLQKALQVLGNEKGGVIVLVTDGEENVAPMIADVEPDLIEAQVRVVSIAFGVAAENEIENLATETNGLSFFVHDDGNSDELNDAFTGSLTYEPTVPTEDLTIVLFQQKYGQSADAAGSNINGVATVDFTVGRELTFRVDYTTKSYVQNFYVKSPSGQVHANVFYDDAAKLEYILIPDVAEEGDWTFYLALGSSSSDYVNVIVTSKPRSNSALPITVECFVPSGTVVPNAAVAPVTLVGVVQQGRNRVIGANVYAIIEQPNSAAEFVTLVDNGVGADNTKNDGIYSRYFLAIQQTGRYTITCYVNSTQSTYIDDGKSQQLQTRTAVGQLNRVASGGSFRVETALPAGDAYPPSRVTDLKVASMQVNQMTLTIEWTAPGDDLDQGTASSYQIKYATKFDDLMDDKFDSAAAFGPQDVISGSVTPLAAGSRQQVSLKIPAASQDVTYFIALRANDKANRFSSTSNVVSVQIATVQQPSTQAPTTPKPIGCNSVLTSYTGVLTSPNYPNIYPNNLDCQWIIRVAAVRNIRLTFTNFDVQIYDYVEVYDGPTVSPGRLLMNHTGSTAPSADVVSSSYEMLVRFVTDGTGNAFSGWRTTYTTS